MFNCSRRSNDLSEILLCFLQFLTTLSRPLSQDCSNLPELTMNFKQRFKGIVKWRIAKQISINSSCRQLVLENWHRFCFSKEIKNCSSVIEKVESFYELFAFRHEPEILEKECESSEVWASNSTPREVKHVLYYFWDHKTWKYSHLVSVIDVSLQPKKSSNREFFFVFLQENKFSFFGCWNMLCNERLLKFLWSDEIYWFNSLETSTNFFFPTKFK